MVMFSHSINKYSRADMLSEAPAKQGRKLRSSKDFLMTRPAVHAAALSLLLGLTFAGAAPASASNADFKLVNKTGYQIDSVFVSPAASDSWGDDIMGRNAVPDGSTVNITFAHGGKACKFDIRVQYNDDDKAEWSAIDLCEYEKISLYWDGKTTRAVGE